MNEGGRVVGRREGVEIEGRRESGNFKCPHIYNHNK